MVGKALALAAAATVFAIAVPASWAQPGMTPPSATPPSPPRAAPVPAVRDQGTGGLLVGGSAGFGLREDGGFAGSLVLGYRSRGNLAWLASVTSLVSDCTDVCSDEIESLAVLGGGLQWWFRPRMWLRATGGFGFMDSYQYNSGQAGLGWSATGGWDLVSGRGAALDARMTFLGGFFEEVGPVRATLGVGITVR